jgi:hypothetical protein
MSFQMNLWQVKNSSLIELNKTKLGSENRLEEWLANDISLLGLELLVIGRQVSTINRGRIDLLAIDLHGDLFILELKRDKTPRDIIAQVLDYASWIRELDYDQINEIATDYLKKSLPEVFREYFDEPLPESINTSHSMVIVASEFDESSERIVQYLSSEYKVNINVVFFSFFRQESMELVGRAWLKDPDEVEETKSRKRAPWSGWLFLNIGEGEHRNWDDNTKYGFIAAGQGARYSRELKRLKVGDKIFAYMQGLGYVGYGEVTQEAKMIKDFSPQNDGKLLLQLPLKASKAHQNSDSPELSEWVVGINWLKTFSREKAKTFKGVFANQHIVCELRQPETVQFLEKEFELSKSN